MTDSPQHPFPTSTSPRISLPGIAAILLTLAPILLLLGWMIFGGTSSRGYFTHAPFQATLGTFVFLTGLLCLFSTLVLAGVRTIAQQHLDALSQLSSQRPE